MEALAEDFADKDVLFYYIYKSLAHPEWNNYLVPQTLDERLLHLAEAKRTLNTKIPWLCDSMENEFARAMGRLPNSDFIIDPDGKIIQRHAWNNVERLRECLTELVGEVERKIPPERLLRIDPKPAETAQTGLLPRLKKPEGLMVLKSQQVKVDGETKPVHYAKLKAEADSDCLFAGTGKLFLTFQLDPVYHVHWNNLGPPVKLSVSSDDEFATVTPTFVEGQKPDVEGDADPREFELDVDGWDPKKPLKIEFSYIGCHDADGWCMPIRQSFEVRCETATQRGITILPEHSARLIRSLNIRDGEEPEVHITADAKQMQKLIGTWAMTTARTFSESEWDLHLSVEDGKVLGWSSYNAAEPKVRITAFDGKELRFWQLDGPAPEEFVLTLQEEKLKGQQLSVFGDFRVTGSRVLEEDQEENLQPASEQESQEEGGQKEKASETSEKKEDKPGSRD